MEGLFLSVLNMSLTASYVILFIILIRLPLKKAPKVISYALWGVVAFRLLCPLSFESMLSLLPASTTPIPQGIAYQQSPQINSGIAAIDTYVNGALPAPSAAASVNPLQIYIQTGAYIWILGIVAMLAYSIVSVIILKRHLKNAQHIERNVYETNNLKTPFVLGIFRPRIYIPAGLTAEEKGYIIRHEHTHIRRFDHIVKPFAFLVLSIHWFNPLVWIAFLLMSDDMELSCDEKVIKDMGNDIKKAYSALLLSLASGKRIINGSPLAFGEGNVKGRIKNVLDYRKSPFWMIIVVVIAAVAVAVCLMTDPETKLSGKPYENSDLTVMGSGTDYKGVEISMRSWKLDAIPTIITVNWSNDSGYEVTYGEQYWIDKYEGGEWVSCAYEDEVAFNDIGYSLSEEAVKNYYNYSYDLSRTGIYRLKTYFFFDKDIPITKDKRYYVWIKFKIPEGVASSTSIFDTVYAFDECLYTNPVSSYYPFEGTGCLYVIGEDSFSIMDEKTCEIVEVVSSVDWNGTSFTDDEWKAMFQIDVAVPDVSGIDSRTMDVLSDKYRLFNMDGEIWLVQMKEDFVWSVYGLKPASVGTDGSGQGLTPYASQQTMLEPIMPAWSLEQSIGADMAILDYASDDIVIFHGYFGLYAYDLNSAQIIRSLDLKQIKCDATQGDDYCEVSVSMDGNTVQLHPMSSDDMYVYTVSKNKLAETVYKPLDDPFESRFVPIEEAVNSDTGTYSYKAVKFDADEYGLLYTYDWTLGTLYYRRGDMKFSLF